MLYVRDAYCQYDCMRELMADFDENTMNLMTDLFQLNNLLKIIK